VAKPSVLIKVAVAAGANITKYLKLILSAKYPINGLSKPGNCKNADNEPAIVKVSESFSMIRGSSGATKAV
jgi:hypothetical protein